MKKSSSIDIQLILYDVCASITSLLLRINEGYSNVSVELFDTFCTSYVCFQISIS